MGNVQAECTQGRHRKTARKDWGRTVGGAQELRTIEFREEAGGLEPRLETQHNGTTGVRIGEAKKPGQ
eukprot:14621534-Heterocapsa_arctica.AAC.1